MVSSGLGHQPGAHSGSAQPKLHFDLIRDRFGAARAEDCHEVLSVRVFESMLMLHRASLSSSSAVAPSMLGTVMCLSCVKPVLEPTQSLKLHRSSARHWRRVCCRWTMSAAWTAGSGSSSPRASRPSSSECESPTRHTLRCCANALLAVTFPSVVDAVFGK